jgi:hypothetical protein
MVFLIGLKVYCFIEVLFKSFPPPLPVLCRLFITFLLTFISVNIRLYTLSELEST